MLTFFPQEKEASDANELFEIEKTVKAQDEINRILKDNDSANIPEPAMHRLSIYPWQI